MHPLKTSRPAFLPAPHPASQQQHSASFRDNRPETTLQRRVLNLVQQKYAAQAPGVIQRMEPDDDAHEPVQMKRAGIPVNADRRLEQEADHMGAQALQMKPQPGSWIGNGGGQVVQLGRDYGDSAKLARERYKVKKHGKSITKAYKFKIWKRGREAQHLIPAQVCKAYGIPKEWANSAVNGMMLPSGRTKTHAHRITALDKGKIMHIKGDGAHPHYNTRVMSFVSKQGWVKDKVSYLQFTLAADHLRKLNRPKRTGPTKGYVDDIPIK